MLTMMSPLHWCRQWWASSWLVPPPCKALEQARCMRASTVATERSSTHLSEWALRSASAAFLTFLLVLGLLLQLSQGAPHQLRFVAIQLHVRPLPQLRHLRLVSGADVYPSGGRGATVRDRGPEPEL